MRLLFSLSALSIAFLTTSSAQASCGSSFCMLNTNWSAQGVWTQPGARLDLRYETIDQDELRSGTDVASADEITHMHHREQSTENNNLQATFDYAFDDTYDVSINLPMVSRKHTHLHVSHSDPSDIETEQWDFTKIGDARVIGRVQLSAANELHTAYGINAGLKLPTGKYDVANDEGEIAERSMQPGTGTTDAIVGAYYRHQFMDMKSQWFTQILLTTPLNEREEFKPGNQINLDVGYRYRASEMLNLLAQLNYSVKGRDKGDEAEPDESGAKTLYFSPGVSISFSKSTQLYSYLHHRLYQDVNGIQLSSKNSVVVGVSTRF